jgi:hypothetical protein
MAQENLQCKEKLLNWFKSNNHGGENSRIAQAFDEQLEEAFKKLDKYCFNWRVGHEVTKDGYAYRLYLDKDGCKISLFYPEDSEQLGFVPDQIEKRDYAYAEKEKDLAHDKEEMIQWFDEHTQFDLKSDQAKEFVSQLDETYQNFEYKGSMWLIGKNLTKEGEPLLISKDNITRAYRFVNQVEEEELGFEDDKVLYQTYDYAEKPEDLEVELDIAKQDYDNEKDAKAADFLQKAWDSISVVEQAGDYREPRKKKEIDNFEYYVNQAKALNPDEENVRQTIVDYEEYLEGWWKRKFDGSKRDLIVVSIVAVLFVVSITFSTLGAVFGGLAGSGDDKGAVAEQVESLEPPDTKEQTGEAAPATSTEISNTDDEPSVFMKIIGGLLMLIFNLLYIGSFVGYYWAKKAPVWLIDKRNENPSRRPISRFFARFTGGLATTTYVEKVRYSDGRTETRTDPFSGPVMALFTWLIYYWVFLTLVPLWTIISYLRNYVWYR